ncbi:hypothetical protein EG68_01141 [Paragonimus skrjabini miyazakii]|uniref:Uncharacterized protein n=1 Tax=Paragonimus skrjabini miyazakii TaxID=59628 RepID=A0A8S9Z4E3_9TREM|nr:hypothetical protein EG68_01141 [Paragonimus skrjabini miyazakii]
MLFVPSLFFLPFYRLDQILGRSTGKHDSTYDSHQSLASRIIKIEHKVSIPARATLCYPLLFAYPIIINRMHDKLIDAVEMKVDQLTCIYQNDRSTSRLLPNRNKPRPPSPKDPNPEINYNHLTTSFLTPCCRKSMDSSIQTIAPPRYSHIPQTAFNYSTLTAQEYKSREASGICSTEVGHCLNIRTDGTASPTFSQLVECGTQFPETTNTEMPSCWRSRLQPLQRSHCITHSSMDNLIHSAHVNHTGFVNRMSMPVFMSPFNDYFSHLCKPDHSKTTLSDVNELNPVRTRLNEPVIHSEPILSNIEPSEHISQRSVILPRSWPSHINQND